MVSCLIFKSLSYSGYGDVTERVWWVQLLVTQKPVNRLSWWKGKFALFQMPATEGREGSGHLSKSQILPPQQAVGQEIV